MVSTGCDLQTVSAVLGLISSYFAIMRTYSDVVQSKAYLFLLSGLWLRGSRNAAPKFSCFILSFVKINEMIESTIMCH